MITLIKPEYYIPIYGYTHMLRGNTRNAYDLGYTKDKVIVMKNAKILEFTKDEVRETDEYASKKLMTVDGRMVGYTGERELHDRFQISSQGVLVIGIVKKSSGFAIKYQTVGLPAVETLPTLEKSLDIAIKEILRDIARFKDAEAFTTHVERKACDICLHEIAKEPKVVVVVQ
jgi:mRNA degradation ribonuclease J1/J2